MNNASSPTRTINTSVNMWAVLNRIYGIFNIENGVKLIW
jgi:hypothetical protein